MMLSTLININVLVATDLKHFSTRQKSDPCWKDTANTRRVAKSNDESQA